MKMEIHNAQIGEPLPAVYEACPAANKTHEAAVRLEMQRTRPMGALTLGSKWRGAGYSLLVFSAWALVAQGPSVALPIKVNAV